MENKKRPSALIIIATFSTLFLLATAVLYFYQFGNSLSSQRVQWAYFGDYFGGVAGPLTAIVGFYALLITIHIQSRALNVSKQELYQTRIELKETAKAATEQSKYFLEKSYIDDCEAVIKEVQEDLEFLQKAKIKIPGEPKKTPIEFSYILFKRITSEELRNLCPERIRSTRDEKLGPDEYNIRQLMKILNAQIDNIKRCPGAHERYRFYVNKYFWVFLVLYNFEIINWNWKDMLDQSGLDLLEEYLRDIES